MLILGEKNHSHFLKITIRFRRSTQNVDLKSSDIELSQVGFSYNGTDTFIMALPEGYQTVIGGATLSGGEKQCISVARAMLKDAPIVILDEATSSIDPENEHELILTINELTHNKTIIMIVHKLQTVKNANQIWVEIDVINGAIVDLIYTIEGVYEFDEI